ncbi:MAG: hypothetical protein ACXADH_11435, partial [Candidatus Kariarchaeaceae archaeon]
MMKRLITIIIFLTLFATSAMASYNCNTLTCDDSTDNTTALNACLAAADAEADNTMILPASDNPCKFTGDVETGIAGYYGVVVPDSVIIDGAAGSKLRGTLILGNDSVVDGVAFSHKQFISVQVGKKSDAVGGTIVSGARVTNNTFSVANAIAIIGYGTQGCIYADNTITSSSTTWAPFLIEGGGHDNVIVNNTITGGITGILLKADYIGASNGGDNANFVRNIIMNNTIRDVDEESISFDSVFDSTSKMTTRELDTVASVSGVNVTLDDADWSGTSGNYVGNYMIVTVENSGTDA